MSEEKAAADTAYDLRAVTAKNIATLRTANKMTQLELGEALSYSDKAISKWERGEAVPDAYVLLAMSRLFGVSVDYILTPHAEEEAPPRREPTRRHIHVAITLVSLIGVYAAVTLAFVILTILSFPMWELFVYALPVALVVLLVFNSLWGRRIGNFAIIALLVAAIVLSVFIATLPRNLWELFLLLAPAELIVIVSRFFFLKKK